MSHEHRGRIIEDGLAVLGGLIAASYVLGVEVFPHVCYSLSKCVNAPVNTEFPWGVVILASVCIAPKTLGRATAGRGWDAITGWIGKRRSRAGERPSSPGGEDDVKAG